MFIFSKHFKKSINLDYIKKTNLINSQKLKSRKGDNLSLSFLNSKLKKQQKLKVRNMLVLELLSLQKSFFYFELNQSKRKKIFLPLETKTLLIKKNAEYFIYNLAKNTIPSIKNLQVFYSKLNLKKTELESSSFDLITKNNSYYNDTKHINLQYAVDLYKVSFYKIYL